MGGGMLRTASKAAALSRPAFGRAASAAGRRSTVSAPPHSAAAGVADAAPMSIHLDESKGLNESANPAMSQWELDDWEFAGWKSEGEELFEDPPPRLVFSPVPTLEEAQEATGDLTRAFESANEHGQMGLFQNNAVIPAMPRRVAQAFSLLQSSPEAQTVVASLASDKSIWEAVLKNEKVMEFCRNNQSSISESIFEDSYESNENNEETHNAGGEVPPSSNAFADFVNNVKVKATEIVDTISDFFQGMFSSKTDANGPEGSSNSGFGSFITPNTFFGLAIAVILVVMLKRA